MERKHVDRASGLAVALVAVLTCSTSVRAGNLLVNGSFELL